MYVHLRLNLYKQTREGALQRIGVLLRLHNHRYPIVVHLQRVSDWKRTHCHRGNIWTHITPCIRLASPLYEWFVRPGQLALHIALSFGRDYAPL